MNSSNRSDHPVDSGTEPDLLDEESKTRLRERLLRSASRGMTVSRREEQQWRAFLPGVEVKLLHHDVEQGLQTALWRMAPGTKIPAHPHGKDEECFILEGSLMHQGTRYQAGDYMLAPAGSRHGTISSDDGVVMLIRGEAVSWRERLLLRASLAFGR
jgi:quercetin dioxygenase-like cupin family protein